MTIPFSGRGCRFYTLGACRYAECLNPGFDARLRCVRLALLEKEWDALLDRADSFCLSERELARIWNARPHAALVARTICPHSRPMRHVDDEDEGGRASESIDCLYIRNGACVLAMPRCGGVCPQFQSGREPA